MNAGDQRDLFNPTGMVRVAVAAVPTERMTKREKNYSQTLLWLLTEIHSSFNHKKRKKYKKML